MKYKKLDRRDVDDVCALQEKYFSDGWRILSVRCSIVERLTAAESRSREQKGRLNQSFGSAFKNC